MKKNEFMKELKNGIVKLSEDERISEIARIISGDSISDISLENAAQMLKNNT